MCGIGGSGPAEHTITNALSTRGRIAKTRNKRTEPICALTGSVPSLTWSFGPAGAEPLRHFSVAATVRPYDPWVDRNSPANREHRAVRPGYYVVGNREWRVSRETPAWLCAHHDQVRVGLPRHSEYFLRRFAKGGAKHGLAPILCTFWHKLSELSHRAGPLQPHALFRERRSLLNDVEHGEPCVVLLRQRESMGCRFFGSMAEVRGKQNILQLDFSRKLALDPRPHRQHGAVRLPENFLGYRADQHFLHFSATMRCRHHQVNLVFCNEFFDGGPNVSFFE